MALGDIVYVTKKKLKAGGKKAAPLLKKVRTAALVILAIIVAVPIAMFAVMRVEKNAEEKKEKAARLEMFGDMKIPKEELFLGDEPDFLSPAMIRTRKKNWTPEEAERFWADPAKIGEDRLKERLHDGIDSLFESVP